MRKELRERVFFASIFVLAVLPLGAPSTEATHTRQGNEESAKSSDVQDAFLQWPLPHGAESYAAIDGKHLHHYVVEQAEISHRYRDRVNPQFWGRIIGASSDAESAEWLAEKFRRIGLSDVRIQPFDLAPQWMPQSWTVSITGGVASMLGLAEHYAKIPQAERRRTMVFIGLDGHHNTGEGSGLGRQWLVEHRDVLFAKTALVINCEHPSTVQTTVRPRYTSGENIVWTNTYTGQQWYAGGPTRPKLQTLAAEAFREFGVSTYLEPNPQPPAGDLGRLYRFVPGVATSDFLHYFHTDEETPETVPWTGLEASTRAYARILDEVNELELGELQRPPELEP